MRKALVLGGTQFLGLHLVERLIDAGYEVTLCNRGQTNPGAFPQLRTILGNRDGNMSGLDGTCWDIVYDLSADGPGHIVNVAGRINRDTRYVFVSTINVYADTSGDGPVAEDDSVFTTPWERVDPEAAESYGQLKALAESEVRSNFRDHHIVRPGVISGPGDPSDRLAYWVTRFADSGPHIVPEPADTPVQFIDVRDLADWLVELGTVAGNVTCNAVGQRTTLSALLTAVERVSGSSVERVALTIAEMRKHQVAAWTDIPLWLPPSDTSKRSFFNMATTGAEAQGFRARSIEQTIRDLLSWADAKQLRSAPRYGLSAAREAELISAIRSE